MTFLGRWLCNLGYHRTSPKKLMEGYTKEFPTTPGHKVTFSYLICQRCGAAYPGSVQIPDYRRFP